MSKGSVWARKGQLPVAAAGAEALSPDSGAKALFVAAFFADAFLATAFGDVAFLAEAPFLAALDFFAALLTGALAMDAFVLVARTTFLAVAFTFVATLRRTLFVAFCAAALETSELDVGASAPLMRNFSRFLTDAIQAGGLPIPVHVFPVFGSLNLGTPAPARLV